METDVLSLSLEGDHFALRRGDQTLATLSFAEVLSFANTAPTYRQFIMSKMRSGAIVATPVAKTAALWDALGANVLLQLEFQPSGAAVYELSPQNCEELAIRLRELLASPPSFQSSKQ
jgi:hypothetical protein